MYKPAHIHFRSYLSLVGLLFVMVLAFSAGGAEDRLSPREYEVADDAIQSSVASGELLVNQALEQRIPRRYIAEQMRILIQQLSRSVGSLKVADADESLEQRLTSVSRTAERAAETLRKIANSEDSQWPELANNLAAISSELHENR